MVRTRTVGEASGKATPLSMLCKHAAAADGGVEGALVRRVIGNLGQQMLRLTGDGCQRSVGMQNDDAERSPRSLRCLALRD